MKHGSLSPAEVDFWLDLDKYADYFEEKKLDSATSTLVFNVDMVRLASIRKAISNFVRILTRKNIPVYFNDGQDNFNDGKTVHISAALNNKMDFDVAVGLALHEASHSLKTDSDIVKIAWANVPLSIWKKSDAKNIRRTVMEKYIHDMWNGIEDRFIDDYVFNTAPGYRGYYVALYDRFWNNPIIDEYLRSDYCRYPSLKSYNFRILSFVNENTDLLDLPRLDEIADVIDIENISRLKTTKDRIDVAFKVIEIILECIEKQDTMPSLPKQSPLKMQGLADPRDFFDFGEESDEAEPGEGDEKGKQKDEKEGGNGEGESDVEKKMVSEISDALGGRETPKDCTDAVDKICEGDVSKDVEDQLDAAMEEQRKFLHGEISKEAVTPAQKCLLDLIEKHGIILVRVDVPKVLPGDTNHLKVDCIVVQKMTKELILLGEEVFPLSSAMKLGKMVPDPPLPTQEAVRKGIVLGTKLGRKLQIRSEVNPFKIVRKKSGKINKRQLHEASFDAEDLFYKIQTEDHNDATMHISVDASSSMNGEKWLKTMTAVVAICKAASMIDNIHVTVSFRATQHSGMAALPYVVLAYDSRVDKFNKIKTLFPYLRPNGCTPEGLAFSAIMSLFENITPDEEDRYFLNLSDGEPYYALSVNGVGISYTGDVGVTHTKSQVDKIRRNGVEILSYFIDQPWYKPKDEVVAKRQKKDIENSPLRRDFRKMYGKNAKFIDVENVVELAQTINGLFLTRCHEKKS